MKPIEISGLTKAFRDKRVLRGIDLDVEPGNLVGMVGPNGSGKTTCLRILLGIVWQDAGTARVLGMNPAKDAVRIRRHSCYLPGETSLYQSMRGSEFLQFALGFYPKLDAQRMEELTGEFQLPLQKRIRGYSAGMKQKLALMAALIPDVELYILDEPDRALDATTRFYLREVLRALRDQGKTILLSSHHLRDVELLADKLVFVLDGMCVSEERVAKAREMLKHRVRLKLRSDHALPADATELHRDLDGTIHVQPDGNPAAWIAAIPQTHLESAEIGTVHLEDLYRVLTAEEPT